MESRKETASAKKASGAYNCTQAVCCTYHDFTGLDEETIKHAGNSFAVGMAIWKALAELSSEPALFMAFSPKTKPSRLGECAR